MKWEAPQSADLFGSETAGPVPRLCQHAVKLGSLLACRYRDYLGRYY